MRGRARSWTDSQFLRAVAVSRNFTDVLRALGLRAAGGNHRAMKAHALRLCADTRHFDDSARRTVLDAARASRARSDADIFSDGSIVTTRTLRLHALRRVFPYRCVACGNEGSWRGHPLTLQLHHRNGRHADNRIENLEWRCPNCHSQTDDFAGRGSRRPRDGNPPTPELFSPASPR